jgi:transposase
MKARYQYRFYPTDQQRLSLAQLFGCVRVVWNDALALCKSADKLPNYNQLSALLTSTKKTEERVWLKDVSSVPYFLSFVVDVEPQDLEPINPSIGIDLRIKTFATFSDGTQVKSPDYSKSERKIRKLQRRLARQQKDSKRRYR